MQITGKECYEFGGVPNPFNPLKWDKLSQEEKEAWEAVARNVIALVSGIPQHIVAFFEATTLLTFHMAYVCEECSLDKCLWCLECEAFTCQHYSLASCDGERCNDCELLLMELCPFCVSKRPVNIDAWECSGEPTFGYEAQFAGLHCCESCFTMLDEIRHDYGRVSQLVAQAKGDSNV